MRGAGGLDLHRRRIRRRRGRSGGDRPTHGRDPGGTRSKPAGPRPHRRLDLRQPARPQGVGTDRPCRLPRPHPRRRAGLRETRQFPHQYRRRDGGGSGGSRRGGAAARLREFRHHPRVGDQARRPSAARHQRGRVMKKRVAVLMGGWSAEREVSLSSGQECATALAKSGYTVRTIDVTRDLTALTKALHPRPDAVFNALHGRGGEDGTVQGILEFLGIPYTHSGVLASAVAMDKPMAKAVFARAGLPLAEGLVVKRESLGVADPLPAPFAVKPTNEGSSGGVRIVRPNDNSWREEAARWPFPGALG